MLADRSVSRNFEAFPPDSGHTDTMRGHKGAEKLGAWTEAVCIITPYETCKIVTFIINLIRSICVTNIYYTA